MANNINVASLIITFNPNMKDLRSTLLKLKQQVSIILVVDNHSENIDEIEHLTSLIKTCILIKNDVNFGIAFALNQGFKEAYIRHVDWVITLDDDSLVSFNLINQLMQVVTENLDDSSSVGIVCPLLKDRRTGLLTHSKKNRNECITSGSLTNVQAWRKIGGFDEWLFIDGVDFDFSRRLFKAGYKILECKSAQLLHEIGHTIPLKVFGIPVGQVMSHTALRKYYQERNYPYIDMKLGTYNPLVEFARFSKHLLSTILFETNKKEKTIALLRGRHDAIKAVHTLKGAKI